MFHYWRAPRTTSDNKTITDDPLYEPLRKIGVDEAAILVDALQNQRLPPDWIYAHEKEQRREQWEPTLYEIKNRHNKDKAHPIQGKFVEMHLDCKRQVIIKCSVPHSQT